MLIGMTTFVVLVGWLVLVALTVGPVFSAQKHGDAGWTWVLAALLLGPLAGIAYFTSRHGMRKVEQRHEVATPGGEISA